MRMLALDVGTRRTGAAWSDMTVGIPLPLDTIHHQSEEELFRSVENIIDEKKIDHLLIGLPRLPSGDEGSQAQWSRHIGALLGQKGLPVTFIDERYSSPKSSSHKHAIPVGKIDGDAAAACALISAFTDKNDAEKHI